MRVSSENEKAEGQESHTWDLVSIHERDWWLGRTYTC